MSPHGTYSNYTNGKCRCDLCRAAVREYRQRNLDHVREWNHQWYLAHSDEVHERTLNWQRAHPAKGRARARKWRLDHPDRTREHTRNSESKRRSRKRGVAIIEDIDRLVVWDRDEGICGICQLPVDPKRWHLDHIVPMGPGNHTYDNVRITHPTCNLRKARRIRSHWRNGVRAWPHSDRDCCPVVTSRISRATRLFVVTLRSAA